MRKNPPTLKGLSNQYTRCINKHLKSRDEKLSPEARKQEGSSYREALEHIFSQVHALPEADKKQFEAIHGFELPKPTVTSPTAQASQKTPVIKLIS